MSKLMQRIIQYLLFAIISVNFLISQEKVEFQKYHDLHPQINLFGNIKTMDTERKLLFFSPLSPQGRPILCYNTNESTAYVLPDANIQIEKRRMYTRYFWDPRAKTNYMYCEEPFKLDDPSSGWFLMTLNSDYLGFQLENNYRYWAHYSPPSIMLKNNRQFNSKYIYHNIRGTYTSSFSILDTKNGDELWEMETVDSRCIDMYWITDSFYIKKTTPSFISGDWDRINSIYNYETGESITFEPEVVIGYGDGVVLTTTEKRNELTGITVWTPDKQILYRDSSFSISGILYLEHEGRTWGNPGIYISYFDYPYIYCNIARITNIGPPSTTLIMNLLTGETFYSPTTYHLFAIFESK